MASCKRNLSAAQANRDGAVDAIASGAEPAERRNTGSTSRLSSSQRRLLRAQAAADAMPAAAAVSTDREEDAATPVGDAAAPGLPAGGGIIPGAAGVPAAGSGAPVPMQVDMVRQVAAAASSEATGAIRTMIDKSNAESNAALSAPGGPLAAAVTAMQAAAAAAGTAHAPEPRQEVPWSERSSRAVWVPVETVQTAAKMLDEVKRCIERTISIRARTPDTVEDVMTGFTPTNFKRQGNASFCIKWYRVFLNMLVKAQVVKELARDGAARGLERIVGFHAARPCVVGKIIVAHVATPT